MELLNFFDMKNKLYFVVILLLVSLANSTTVLGQLKAEDLDKPTVKRELLKEYFLCMCLMEGFKDINIGEHDVSESVYFDITNYATDAFQDVKVYARNFVDTIQPPIAEGFGDKKAIVLKCIEKYKSKEVDKFIKSLDKYMNK